MPNKEKPHATNKPQRHFRVRIVAGLTGLGGTGCTLWLLGPAASYQLGMLLVLGLIGLTWTTIFSSREEPSRRLRKLIKDIRGRRR
jgi:hypothetical protein